MRKIIAFAAAVIAGALLVSASGATGTSRQLAGARAGSENIVQVAASNPQLSTLVTLVKQAGLVAALSKPGAHLTVFAPTNAAFAALKKADPMTFKAVATTPPC